MIHAQIHILWSDQLIFPTTKLDLTFDSVDVVNASRLEGVASFWFRYTSILEFLHGVELGVQQTLWRFGFPFIALVVAWKVFRLPSSFQMLLTC